MDGFDRSGRERVNVGFVTTILAIIVGSMRVLSRVIEQRITCRQFFSVHPVCCMRLLAHLCSDVYTKNAHPLKPCKLIIFHVINKRTRVRFNEQVFS